MAFAWEQVTIDKYSAHKVEQFGVILLKASKHKVFCEMISLSLILKSNLIKHFFPSILLLIVIVLRYLMLSLQKQIAVDKYCTHHKEQFGGNLMTKIFSLLQVTYAVTFEYYLIERVFQKLLYI